MAESSGLRIHAWFVIATIIFFRAFSRTLFHDTSLAIWMLDFWLLLLVEEILLLEMEITVEFERLRRLIHQH